MNFYKQFTKGELPSYMLEPNAVGYFDVSGSMKDDVNSAATDAIQNSFIQSAPSDALPYLGSNFNIARSPVFTDAQYKAKLEEHVTYWQTAGTPARMITEIKSYGYPNVSIIPEWIEDFPGHWIKNLPITDFNAIMNTPNDNWYGGGQGVGWWSNFWIVIRQPHPFTQIKWGTPEAGKWKTGGTSGPYKWGGIAGDQNALRALVALIRKLKPAWSSCRGIIFEKSGMPVWGGFNWNDGTLWGLPTGSYFVYYVLEDWEE